MKKYEYHMTENMQEKELIETLRTMGAEGWEVIKCIFREDKNLSEWWVSGRVLFMREVGRKRKKHFNVD